MAEASAPQPAATAAAASNTGKTDRGANDKQAVAWVKQASDQLRVELAKVIVGQDEVIDQLLIGIFAKGHCMLEGVPGLAKTLLISTLSKCLDMSFKRIQFTPDLMPSNIVELHVYDGAHSYNPLQRQSARRIIRPRFND